jgi:hypothetical protein
VRRACAGVGPVPRLNVVRMVDRLGNDACYVVAAAGLFG